MDSGRQLARRPHYTDLLPVAFSPDGTTIYIPDGTGSLESLDADTLRPLHSAVPLGTGVRSLLADPSDGSLLVLRIDGSVVRVEPSTGKILDEAPPGPSARRRSAGRSLRTAPYWQRPTRPATCD